MPEEERPPATAPSRRSGCPSTSSIVGAARRGARRAARRAPTARIARTGELTPPGISSLGAARAELGPRASEPPRQLLRPVRDDESAPARLIAVRRLERGRALVEVPGARRPPSPSRTRRETLYAATGQSKRSRTARMHVEVRQRRLDHQHVGALGEVELALAQRLAHVRRIHLVAAAVAERRRRLGDLAERPVEGRGVLRRVRDDRRLRAARSRIAPTRPSIMSLGATTSAPASTWLTAVRASSSSVSSFATSPSRITPQWPCDVYSQRQTSVTSDELRDARRAARAAPAGRSRPRPRRPSPRRPSPRGCRRGSPPCTPSAASSPASATRSSTEKRRDRRAAPRSRTVDGPDEERHHEVVEVEPRLAHERAQRVGAAQPAEPRGGEGAHREQGYVSPSTAVRKVRHVSQPASWKVSAGSAMVPPMASARNRRAVRPPAPRGSWNGCAPAGGDPSGTPPGSW